MSFQYANCNRECDCCDALLACTQHDAVLYREEMAEVERLVAEQHPPKTISGAMGDIEERLQGIEERIDELVAILEKVIAFFNRMAQGLD